MQPNDHGVLRMRLMVSPRSPARASRFGFIRDNRLARTHLVGEAEFLQLAEPFDIQRQELVWRAIRARREIDDAMTIPVANQLAIELRGEATV